MYAAITSEDSTDWTVPSPRSCSAGISSGASAPEILVENFIDALKTKFNVSINEVEIIKEDVVFKVPNRLN